MRKVRYDRQGKGKGKVDGIYNFQMQWKLQGN
jgi:hypothetical protein